MREMIYKALAVKDPKEVLGQSGVTTGKNRFLIGILV